MSDNGVLTCRKDNPALIMLPGECYEIIGQDATTGQPLVDVPSTDNSGALGIVVSRSLAGDNVVDLKFSGVVRAQALNFFGSATPGQTIGGQTSQKIPVVGGTGLGTILSVLIAPVFITPGWVIADLGAGGAGLRWKEYDPTP